VTCEDDAHASGLTRVLHGSFTPGSPSEENPDGTTGGARQGAGSMIFQAFKLREMGGAKDIPGGTFTIDYDHRGGGREVQVHVGMAEDDETAVLRLKPEVDYFFNRNEDGSGHFEYAIFADFIGEGIFGDHNMETLNVGLQWQTDRAGRADAKISGGNLEDNVVNATQCWNANLDTVFYEDSGQEHPTVGQVEDCVFSDPYDFR
jgi:hypothetical protein